MYRRQLLGLAFLVAAPLAALAQTPGPATQPAPIAIVNQIAFPLNDRVRYAACVSFLNTSKKLITAVRFDFNLINAFHESISHFHGDRLGEFSAGVTIDGPTDVRTYNIGDGGGSLGGANQKIKNCWLYYSENQQAVNMTVAVTHVIFADGSEWVPALVPAAPVSPSGEASATPAPAAAPTIPSP
jgi:hypothetical protein